MSERNIPVERIDPNPFQTRTGFDEGKIRELAESIASVGLLQKILVRPHPEVKGRYQIAHGERRLRVFRLLGRQKIPATIRELTDKQVAEITLIENVQRENLDPFEEATGFQTLIDGFGYSKAEIARRIGKSRSYVSNSVRFLGFPDHLKEAVRRQTLSVGHVVSIMGLPNSQSTEMLRIVVEEQSLSVTQTKKIVQAARKGDPLVKWIGSIRTSDLKPHPFTEEPYELGGYEFWLSSRKPRAVQRATVKAMREEGQIDQLLIFYPNEVLYGAHILEAAKELNLEEVKAEIVFPTGILRGERVASEEEVRELLKLTALTLIHRGGLTPYHKVETALLVYLLGLEPQEPRTQIDAFTRKVEEL